MAVRYAPDLYIRICPDRHGEAPVRPDPRQDTVLIAPAAGARAVATTSAGVAWSLGVPDAADLGADRAAVVRAGAVGVNRTDVFLTGATPREGVPAEAGRRQACMRPARKSSTTGVA
ncbi:hypothetical protein [Nonomuraea sp. NPDC050691]|uniref:hypothetical protein n=1 Tax=Nonomuraea sp. NPDC050691 TaxID=3155661 RepID=UPI0033EB862B